MVTYYKIGDAFCAAAHSDLPYEKTEKPAAGTKLTWLFTGGPPRLISCKPSGRTLHGERGCQLVKHKQIKYVRR